MEMKYIWSYLMHLSTNMWYDRDPSRFKTEYRKIRGLSNKLLFSENIWQEWVNRMQEIGVNQVVIDVGDGVRFPSHPELAIEGSWSPQRMRDEVERLKKKGIEAIPKLNFSTSHDSWLKEYHRLISTPEYYRVCEDLIGDIIEIFGKPRFLHLGYDEESSRQLYADFSVARQGDLWWRDLNWFVKTVEKKGSRPWCWADAGVNRPDEFVSKCPKSMVLSNWYYGMPFDSSVKQVRFYERLDKEGFDQIPCGSVWGDPENFQATASYCHERFNHAHLKGFLMANWARTLPRYRDMASRSFDAMEEAISVVERGERPRLPPAYMWVLKDGRIDRWYKDVDRIRLYRGETLMVDFGRTANLKPAFEIENQAGEFKLSVVSALKTDGAGVARSPESAVETIKINNGEDIYDGLPARKMRFLGIESSCSVTIITKISAINA